MLKLTTSSTTLLIIVIFILSQDVFLLRATSVEERDFFNNNYGRCYYYNSTECQKNQEPSLINLNVLDRLSDDERPQAGLSPFFANVPSRCIYKQSCRVNSNSNTSSSTLSLASTNLESIGRTSQEQQLFNGLNSDKQACFIVWNNDSSVELVSNMGCMHVTTGSHQDQCYENKCINAISSKFKFCCCKSDLCNANFSLPDGSEIMHSNTSDHDNLQDRDKSTTDSILWLIAIISIGAVMAAIFVLMVLTRVKRQRRSHEYPSPKQDNQQFTVLPYSVSLLDDSEQEQEFQSNPEIDMENINLELVLASGRFGKVWKAATQLHSTNSTICVAVKIFTPQERSSWDNECEIYRLPQMEHSNLLKFFGAKSHSDGDGLNVSYWLVTEYHERGSLHDYLKNNVLSYEEMIYIAESIANGMNHLHEEGRSFSLTNSSPIAADSSQSQDLVEGRDQFAADPLSQGSAQGTSGDSPSGESLIQQAQNNINGHNDKKQRKDRKNKPAKEMCKPSIAHRDFKSKNVLLKHDLTPVIADFGLAYIFYPDKPISNSHGQIGTRRYMAPEILEGSISFTLDSFIRIDMYAVGLVLWEMLTRCQLPNTQQPPGPYKLPYEAELGPSPANDTIAHFVATERRRPLIKSEWLRDSGAKKYCETVIECWDNDAEARLSASCVQERMTQLRNSKQTSSTTHHSTNYDSPLQNPPMHIYQEQMQAIQNQYLYSPPQQYQLVPCPATVAVCAPVVVAPEFTSAAPFASSVVAPNVNTPKLTNCQNKISEVSMEKIPLRP